MNWPNFYIVGAAKCGTTSIWGYLGKHPDVFFPKVKEPSYFMSIAPPPELENEHCDGNFDFYQRLYQDSNGYKAVGDASTGYLRDANAARRIHEVCPHARIVILLRDPVERAHSAFLMEKRVSDYSVSFLEWVQNYRPRDKCEQVWGEDTNIEQGMYYEQVKRYIDTFGRDQVGVYLFEELEKDSRRLTEEIARHIGVDPQLLNPEEFERVYNRARVPRFAKLYKAIGPKTRAFLRYRVLHHSVIERIGSSRLLFKFDKPLRNERAAKILQALYEPDLRRLEELLGRKLPELRNTWT